MQQRILPQWLGKGPGQNGRGRGGRGGRRFGAEKTAGGDKKKIVLSICDDGYAAAKFPYDPMLVEFFRSVRTAHFDRENTQWKFSVDVYNQVVTGLRAKRAYTVEEPPAEELDRLNLKSYGTEPEPQAPCHGSRGGHGSPFGKNIAAKGDNSEYVRRLQATVPPQLFARLKNYQIEAIAQVIAWDGRALLADEMGLGKTAQALTIAQYYKDDWPLLIVCPSSLRLTMAAEFNKWLGIARDEINVVFNSRADLKSRVCIISYDLVSKFSAEELSHFTFVIADESHYLKSYTAKRTKALVPVLQRAKRALLLTGTPALSRPIELFSQLNALDKRRWKNPVEFGKRYCNGRQTQFGWDFTGASNLDELHDILSRTCMIRRHKKDVLSELPAKRRQIVWVPADPKPMKDVTKLMTRCANLEKAMKLATGNEFAELQNARRMVLTELYTLTGKAKLTAAIEYIDDLLTHPDLKFLVFAHHRAVMDEIASKLTRDKIGHIRLDGDTKQQDRQPLCDRFQSDPECRVGLLSITAAGVGLTLHAATLVLFAELAWTPTSLLQCEDRAHRIGQVDCVDVKYLLSERTLDDIQWPLILRKMSVVGQSIDGKAASMDTTEESAMDETSFGDKGQLHDLGDLDNLALGEVPIQTAPAPSTPLAPQARALNGHGALSRKRILAEEDDDGSNSTDSSAVVARHAHKARRISVSSDDERDDPGRPRSLQGTTEADGVRSRPFSTSVGDEEAAEPQPVKECPVCGATVAWYEIDAHVNDCLDQFAN